MAAAKEFNPWNVSSLDEFLFYNCPECESKYSSKEQFVGHAMFAHKNARDASVVLAKILIEKVEASNKHEPTKEVDMEDFDDNGNDNNTGIHIDQFLEHALVVHENARDILIENLKASNVREKVDPEGFDDNGNDNNAGIHFMISDDTTSAEAIDDNVEEEFITSDTFETSTLNPEKFGLTDETKCKHCGKEYSSKYTLKNHIQRVHPDVATEIPKTPKVPKVKSVKGNDEMFVKDPSTGRYECVLCAKTFCYKAVLPKHKNFHIHKTKCPICHEIFGSNRKLRKHRKTH